MMRQFICEIEGCGHITIGVTQAVIDELMSEEWASSFYTFRTEHDVIENLARWMHLWPPGWDGEHNLDGIAHLTTENLRVIEDHISFDELWEDVEIDEQVEAARGEK